MKNISDKNNKNPILYRDRIFYTFCYSDRKSGNRVQPEKMPADKSVMSNSLIHNKELPIYCVDTKKPVVALSFDAAWGAYRSLNTIFVPPHFFHMLTKKHRHFYINCSLYDALPSYLPSAAGMYNHAFYHI